VSQRSPKPRRVPKYGKHKATGQALVILNGKTHYLGKHGTPESKELYDRKIADWLANGRVATETAPGERFTVNDLLLAFDKAHEGYYQPGEQTDELENIRDAVTPLSQLYGRSEAKDFGPKNLKAVRQTLVGKKLSRSYVNRQVARIRRIFRWGVEEELIPASVHHGLQAVRGLRRGMADVKESEPVRPVPWADVKKTLPHLPPAVRVMVQVQRLLGCRPGEVCRLRTADLEQGFRDPTTGVLLWRYRLERHKTLHHTGREKIMYVGPEAQRLLTPWLRPDAPEAFLFSPAESEVIRLCQVRKRRQSPLRPSERVRKVREDRGDRYKTHAYGVAIRRACLKAKVPAWSPNQLRHSRLTELRHKEGLEVAKAVGGHSKIETTQIYAEADQAAAMNVMARLG
jgi:integrase